MASISLFIISTTSGITIDRRFASDMSVLALKNSLELIVGTAARYQELQLKTEEDVPVCTMSDGSKTLSDYGVASGMKLLVVDKDPQQSARALSDLSQVEKVEMEDSEYDKREDSVRAFKRRMKMGRFGEGEGDNSAAATLAVDQEAVAGMTVGDRCSIAAPTRYGSVMFIGETKFKPGCIWVGVKLDLPLGKHNGSVGSEQYFQCEDKYGVFLRPKMVTVGDFPEEAIEDEEL